MKNTGKEVSYKPIPIDEATKAAELIKPLL
jgi:hypothetical protein